MLHCQLTWDNLLVNTPNDHFIEFSDLGPRWALTAPSAYAQRANAYVHFYDVVAQTGRWNEPGLAPYQVEGVWAHAPKARANEAPEGLKAAYARHYGPRSLRLLKP